jgi:hypothetical protein
MDKIQFGRTGSRIYSFSESKKKEKKKEAKSYTPALKKTRH